MEKIKSGTKFDEVARQYSEDKARSGVRWTVDLSLKCLKSNFIAILGRFRMVFLLILLKSVYRPRKAFARYYQDHLPLLSKSFWIKIIRFLKDDAWFHGWAFSRCCFCTFDQYGRQSYLHRPTN